MKPEPLNNPCRGLALSAVGLTTLLAVSCALPRKEAWNQINQRGLIPVLIDGGQTALVSNPAVKPSQESVVRVQAVTTPAIVKTLYADAVPGRPGYVLSPHTAPRKVVDVRGFRAGEEVRCPFTSQPFLVPDFSAVADAARPAPQRPVRPVAEVVSSTGSTPEMLERSLTRLDPEPEMKAAPPAPVEPVTPPAAPVKTPATLETAVNPAVPSAGNSGVPPAAGNSGLLYGSRVPGRPGFVYSPHAAKTQLVDVAGTAPGVVVKCPYTNKLFRVPEVNSEEINPGTSPVAPAAEPANKPDAPGSTEPAPSAPPAPGTLPLSPGNPR